MSFQTGLPTVIKPLTPTLSRREREISGRATVLLTESDVVRDCVR
jgi:hypothetical protein